LEKKPLQMQTPAGQGLDLGDVILKPVEGGGVFVAGAGVAPKEKIEELLEPPEVLKQAPQALFPGSGLVKQMPQAPAVESLVVELRDDEHGAIAREISQEVPGKYAVVARPVARPGFVFHVFERIVGEGDEAQPLPIGGRQIELLDVVQYFANVFPDLSFGMAKTRISPQQTPDEIALPEERPFERRLGLKHIQQFFYFHLGEHPFGRCRLPRCEVLFIHVVLACSRFTQKYRNPSAFRTGFLPGMPERSKAWRAPLAGAAIGFEAASVLFRANAVFLQAVSLSPPCAEKKQTRF
jgi:hypothetical protein